MKWASVITLALASFCWAEPSATTTLRNIGSLREWTPVPPMTRDAIVVYVYESTAEAADFYVVTLLYQRGTGISFEQRTFRKTLVLPVPDGRFLVGVLEFELDSAVDVKVVDCQIESFQLKGKFRSMSEGGAR
jgi:hypothetical protein